MRIKSWLKPVLAVLMIGVLFFSVTGCGDLESIALRWLESWADSHSVNPTTPGGAVNLAKRAASGSTGDADADAVIGIVKQFDSINEGDKLMAEGQQLRSQGKLSEAADAMDDAIDKRPQDWTYRVSRVGLAYQNDDMNVAVGEYNEGREIIRDAGKQENIRYHTETIDELESSVLDPSKMSPNTKNHYYYTLTRSYEERGALTDNDDDKKMAVQYNDLWQEAMAEEVEGKRQGK